MYVKVTRINEANNDLILSEREAWVSYDGLSVSHFLSVADAISFLSLYLKKKKIGAC